MHGGNALPELVRGTCLAHSRDNYCRHSYALWDFSGSQFLAQRSGTDRLAFSRGGASGDQFNRAVAAGGQSPTLGGSKEDCRKLEPEFIPKLPEWCDARVYRTSAVCPKPSLCYVYKAS